jgi:hypothetical protein
VKIIRIQIERQKKEEEAKQRFVEKLRQRLRMLNVIKEGSILENDYQSMRKEGIMMTKEENEEREKREVKDDKRKSEILFDPKYDPFFLSQVLKRR